ncbi:type 2 lantibiotic (TIGR03893 family) [Anoxybacillus calidus]|jgi:type 2 lantibiotic (TIGR03893 family)|uniref:Type 2 lantibiotic (TIGR03893 family) n=1 Tax=[Anoxybacillus] calidus TaxID=575178 RepID=A0A7V9YZM3_9BACL|nr:mersacidin family lantibiotic [Anoxybacillus calidus]MBA2871394.1 type 2 lantibiotic (TIGR03893 family) [Anoxybacillus calidus]
MTRNQVLEAIHQNHPSGERLVEVSAEELQRVYGGGDVQPETSPACVTIGIGIGIGISKLFC